MFQRLRKLLGGAPLPATEFQEGVELGQKLLYHFDFLLDGVNFDRRTFPIDSRTPILPGYFYGFVDVCSQCAGNSSGGNTSVNAAITLLNAAFPDRGQDLVQILICEGPKTEPDVRYAEGVSYGANDANKFMNRETNLGLCRLLKAKFADCCGTSHI